MAPFAAAHRGLSAEQPENTLAAFEAAAKAGFPCIELDMRVTRDHEVVVLHDAGLERTTDGHGRVADVRYDELRSYKTGAGPVPRLDDVLSALRGWDGLWNLEIKAHRATEPTLHLVDHHKLGTRAKIMSFDPRAVQVALEQRPDLPRGLIILGPPEQEEIEIAKDLRCTWFNADHDYLTKESVQNLRDQGLRVEAFTVNDPRRAAELASWGVECIITDRADVNQVLLQSSGVQRPFW